MKRISSKSTFFNKKVFPAIWFAITLTIACGVIVSAVLNGDLAMMFAALIPLFMAGFGYVLFRLLLFDLVDEVWDDGNSLVVVNRHETFHVDLADVVNVNSSQYTNPPRVTLLLRTGLPWGKEVTFIPAESFGQQFTRMFRPPAIATELIERVDAARRGAR